jgi:hypothetical protein
MAEHHDWLAHAGALLGLPETIVPAPDYINTFIGWRVDTARALLDHIEKTTGRNWVRALISSRAISECTIYGRFADEVHGGGGTRRFRQAAMPHALVPRDLPGNA